MKKDPICGMEVEEREAKATSVHNKENYYFCSKTCKREFDKDPEGALSRPAHCPLNRKKEG